jgi:hypothetical protein
MVQLEEVPDESLAPEKGDFEDDDFTDTGKSA